MMELPHKEMFERISFDYPNREVLNRALIISDIHGYDYPDYNIYPGYRLDQLKILAKLVIENAKAIGAKYLIIAGDISEHANVRPYIEHAIKEMLWELGDHFEKVYYILGQHDLDVKSENQAYKDSFINAIVPPNYEYMDKKELTISNTSIAFANWRPGDVDLSWFTKSPDLFIGHVTNTNTSLFGQEIDRTKFKVGICGDIHKFGPIQNLYNIGSCTQNKMGDQIWKTGMFYDFDTQNFGYINLDPNLDHLLALRYTSSQDTEGFVGESSSYNVFKPSVDLSFDGVVDGDAVDWGNLDELIKELMQSNNLEALHEEVESTMLIEDVLDFNFRILEFTADGYRSLNKFHVKFKEGEKILIQGKNGSGKSSVLNALRDWLFGDRFIKKNATLGTDHVELHGKVLYQGNVYEWVRGTSEWGLRINDGEWEPYNSKKSFEEDLPRRLPFLNYEDIMYYKSKDIDPMGRLNSDRKMYLIQKFNRLDKVESLNNKAGELLDSKSTAAKATKVNLDAARYDLVQKEKYYENYSSLVGSVEELDKSIITKSNLKSAKSNYDSYLKSLEESKKAVEESLATLNAHKESLGKLDLGQLTASKTAIESELKVNNEGLKSVQDWIQYINRSNTTISSNKSIIREKTREIGSLAASKCYVCESIIDQSKIDTLLLEAKSILNTAEEANKVLLDSFGAQTLESLNKSARIYSDKISQLNSNLSSVNSSITTINNSGPLVARLESQLNEKNAYLSNLLANPTPKVDLEDPDSFDRLLLELVSQRSNLNIKMNTEREIADIKLSINELESIYEKDLAQLEEYDKYFKLTSRTGAICKHILERLALKHSDSQFQYYVEEVEYRGNDFLELGMKFNVKGNMIDYFGLSDGQKIVAGIKFFCDFFGGIGLLIFDEHLKHVDRDYMIICSDHLRQLRVNNMIVSTHDQGFTVYDKIIKLKLNEEGVTSMTGG